MAEYRRDFRFLAEHDAEFNEKYRNEWVAVLDCHVVLHSPNHEKLLAQLEKKGLLQKEPVIAHCPAVPENAVF